MQAFHRRSGVHKCEYRSRSDRGGCPKTGTGVFRRLDGRHTWKSQRQSPQTLKLPFRFIPQIQILLPVSTANDVLPALFAPGAWGGGLFGGVEVGAEVVGGLLAPLQTPQRSLEEGEERVGTPGDEEEVGTSAGRSAASPGMGAEEEVEVVPTEGCEEPDVAGFLRRRRRRLQQTSDEEEAESPLQTPRTPEPHPTAQHARPEQSQTAAQTQLVPAGGRQKASLHTAQTTGASPEMPSAPTHSSPKPPPLPRGLLRVAGKFL